MLSPSPSKGLLVSITIGKFHNLRVKKMQSCVIKNMHDTDDSICRQSNLSQDGMNNFNASC